jgi:prepilin-type N-terminal cleavage/methylation domain-containing protein
MRRTAMRGDGGFSILELLVVISIVAILFSLSAVALRNYWRAQALQGGKTELTSHLRRAQEQAVTESHPIIFGVQFRLGEPEWATVRFDPDSGVCAIDETRALSAGVVVSAAEFLDAAGVTDVCEAQLPPLGMADDEFVFFFPRGTATAGSVTLLQPSSASTETLDVTPITGRVNES